MTCTTAPPHLAHFLPYSHRILHCCCFQHHPHCAGAPSGAVPAALLLGLAPRAVPLLCSPIHAFPWIFQSSGTKPLRIWWLGYNLRVLLVTAIPAQMPFSQGSDHQTAGPLVQGLGCSRAELPETRPASAWGSERLSSAGILLTTRVVALIYTHSTQSYTYNYIHCAVYM